MGRIRPVNGAGLAFDDGAAGEFVEGEFVGPLHAPLAVAVGVGGAAGFAVVLQQHAAGAGDDELLGGEIGFNIFAFDVGAPGDAAVGGGLRGVDPGAAAKADRFDLFAF